MTLKDAIARVAAAVGLPISMEMPPQDLIKQRLQKRLPKLAADACLDVLAIEYGFAWGVDQEGIVIKWEHARAR